MGLTTIELPDEVIARLQAVADRRRVPLSQVVVEALEECLRRDAPGDAVSEETRSPAAEQALSRVLGSGASGHTDTARRIGEERTPPLTWR